MTKIEQSETSGKEGIWSSILQTVQSSSTRSSSSKSVFILGPKDCGKSFLLNKLKLASVDVNSDALGLEYTYAEVKDEDNDDFSATLGAWLLDADLIHPSILPFALNESNFEDTLILLLVDLSHPWTVMDTLKQQLRVLEEHVDTLVGIEDQLPSLKANLKTLFQTYSVSGAPSNNIEGSEQVLPPLEAEVLSRNLGLPIVIVGCKSDLLPALEREFNYRDEHFDFIQQHIRKFALKCGAAVVYTSAKDNKNLDLLRKYILHRLYGISFKETGSIVDRDAVFIPMGWDSESKINILLDGVASFRATDIYETVIKKPHKKTANTSDEVTAKDDQVFLQEHAPKLLKLREKITGSAGTTGSILQPDKQFGTSTIDPLAANASPSASPAKAVQKKEVMQSFFQSLLNQPKKSGGSGGSSTSSAAGATQQSGGSSTSTQQSPNKNTDTSRKDVHAALDQIRNN